MNGQRIEQYKFPIEHQPDEKHSNVAILCPGQDVQELGMFDEIKKDPAGLEVTERGDEFFLKHFGYKITEKYEKDADPNKANRTQDVQPAVYLLTLAVHNKLRYQHRDGYATLPRYLTGNSMGMVTATTISGATDFDKEYSGLWLIGMRGKLMQEEGDPRPTSMAAVIGANKDEISAVLKNHRELDLCLINDKTIFVIGGPDNSLALARQEFESLRFKVRPVKTDRSMHGRYVEPALPEFRRVLNEVNFKTPMIPLVGTLTGFPIRDVEGVISELEYGFANTFDNTKALGFFDRTRIHMTSELNKNGTFTNIMERTYQAVATHRLPAAIIAALGLSVAIGVYEAVTHHHPKRGDLIEAEKS